VAAFCWLVYDCEGHAVHPRLRDDVGAMLWKEPAPHCETVLQLVALDWSWYCVCPSHD